jgi:hypothetical protein
MSREKEQGMRFRFIHLLGESRVVFNFRHPVSNLKTTALSLVVFGVSAAHSAALPTNGTEALPRRGVAFPFNASTFQRFNFFNPPTSATH